MNNVLHGTYVWIATMSDVTINLILLFGIFGLFGGKLADRLSWLIRLRPKGSRAPLWFSVSVFVILMLALVGYMSLWGMEARW